MARKFIGKKELAFVQAINKELIQNIVGQAVYYFQILADKTKSHDLYNEAITKVSAPPVLVNALVYYENSQEQVTALPPDAKFSIDVFFHTDELKDRNLAPNMGDFVQFGEVVYEIYAVTHPQIIFGMVDQKIMTKCTCGPARKGQFLPPKQPMPAPHDDLNAPQYRTQPPPPRKK